MEIIYTTIGSSVLLATLGFLFRNLIKIRLTNAVKHEYAEKIEKLKSELKAKNDELTSEMAYLKDSKLQRDAEARQIKQDYYHMFLEAVSIKFSHHNDMESEDAISANRKFCVEVNRLPLYASQEVVEFVSKFAGGGKAPEFTELYEVIRKDLCSNAYSGFDNLAQFHFQIPNKIKANKAIKSGS
ncbi:hypothetical protein L1285_08175 [Pseudoalteromonas sp. DL2-H2.2]|uniref:hypothetical protein n=1 Tax=Pseudoalteromonas sp. DL2-H2.2 TaxID=2908889 RepID=UPI001F2C85BF|nr:hypothetical protein [Pseudoalteromonas sp. DL2-H2.2]MCF2908299.1 hypothetical protein [Pseudoalteromonas sp. DL2-H2.2]